MCEYRIAYIQLPRIDPDMGIVLYKVGGQLIRKLRVRVRIAYEDWQVDPLSSLPTVRATDLSSQHRRVAHLR